MLPPRGVEERIRWFLSHSPGGTGLCARHSWRSLGGDYGNPPRWGCPDANCVHDKVRASGRYWTGGTPPRGALVLWRYGANGHAAISYGDGRIATTDPTGKPGGTGIEPLAYPRKWGAGTHIWTDEYNGVRFAVGGTTMAWNIGQERVVEIPSKTLTDGVYNEVGRITLPGGDYLLTLQGRLEAGSWARVEFARVGWGSDPDGRDETGNDLWPPAPDGKATSYTHNHQIAGGGPVAWEIKPYGVGDTTVVTSIVVKALRVS